MLKVIEAFSGIGAQAKALERCRKQYGTDYEIINTVDWDVNAIIAYDLIHNGEQKLEDYQDMSKQELLERLDGLTLSPDGKDPYKPDILKNSSKEMLCRLAAAIDRTHNKVSITDIRGDQLPGDIDIFTYSFPCQNLSVASVVHGKEYMSGINRNVKNRSGMLWEVERILKEMSEAGIQLPRFLVMENVTTLHAERHIRDFESWKSFLRDKGYYNLDYAVLKGTDFGSAQARSRSYMISVYLGKDDQFLWKEMHLNAFLEYRRLDESREYISTMNLPGQDVKDILCTDYSDLRYKREADFSQLSDTPSRWEIVKDNEIIPYQNDGILKYPAFLKTVTTKQDRNPTTCLIEYNNPADGKIPYRYMTARECILAMGFDEADYDILIRNNFLVRKDKYFFTPAKIEKMAGNSIVVNVLQAIFRQIEDIRTEMKHFDYS